MTEQIRISRRHAIEAKCHDCQCQYLDGKNDCEVVMCPLYLFMPYRKRKPTFDWQQYSPRRIGKVSWDEINGREPAKTTAEIDLNNFGGSTPTENIHGAGKPQKAGFTNQKMDVL